MTPLPPGARFAGDALAVTLTGTGRVVGPGADQDAARGGPTTIGAAPRDVRPNWTPTVGGDFILDPETAPGLGRRGGMWRCS